MASIKMASILRPLWHLSWLVFLTSPHIVPSYAQGQKIMACYLHGGRFENFTGDAIDPFLCTHVLCANGVVTPDGIDTAKAVDLENIKGVASLKAKNPNLKVIVSLSQGFSSVVGQSSEVIMRFSLQAVIFLEKLSLDGVDLDWEFPKSHDKDKFIIFIKILSEYLHSSNLLLTMATPPYPSMFEEGFDIATINEYVDFVTVMTYGMTGGASKVTHYVSSLYTPKGQDLYESTADCLSYLLYRGLSKDKMLMGIPTYGRSSILVNPKDHGLHSPVKGPAGPSPYSSIPGTYIYADVCVASREGATLVYDDVNVGQYLYNGSVWASFEAIHSLSRKMEWLKLRDLAGVGIWAYQFDDFGNVCGDGAMPLLNFIHGSLKNALQFSP